MSKYLNNRFWSQNGIWVIVVIVAGWGAALTYSAATARSLYGDGAWFVLQHLLSPHHFNDYDTQRTFASLISQTPILFGQRLGFDSVASYAALYSFGVFAIPALLMVAALALVRKQPPLFAMLGLSILIYGFGVNFINSEANLFFGFVLFSLAILAYHGPAPILRGFVLPVVAIALLRAYEGMLLVGPSLVLWAAIAVTRSEDYRERIGLMLAALLYFLGVIIGLGGFLSPRDPNNAAGFLSDAIAYLSNPHAFLLVAGLVVIPGICWPSRRFMISSAVASALLGLGFLLGITRLEGFYSFSIYYQNRTFLVLFLPIFVGIMLVVFAFRPAWFRASVAGPGYALFLIPLAFALMGDAVGTYRWSTYVETFCSELRRPAKPLERVEALKQSGARTAWGWTHPTMSALLRDRGSQAVVANEPGAFGWEPFDPEKTPTILYRGLCQAPLLRAEIPDTFDIPIAFTTGAYPSYITSVSGLSRPEGWATWTEGSRVEFHFARALPRSFDLKLRIGSAFGSNKSLPVKVRVGGQELSFIVDREPAEITLEFRGVEESNVIYFEIPSPESPAEKGMGEDPRKLGIAFVTLAVNPK